MVALDLNHPVKHAGLVPVRLPVILDYSAVGKFSDLPFSNHVIKSHIVL